MRIISHLEMYDDQERYFREVVKFIKDVEAGKLKRARGGQ